MSDRHYGDASGDFEGYAGGGMHYGADGTVSIQLAAGKSLQLLDASGNVIARLDEGSRLSRIAVIPLSGAAIHAGVVGWVNPEAGAIIINKALVDVTTVATAAANLDVGTTPTSIATASDTLLDGIDVHTAAGLLGLADGDAPGAGNGLVQAKLAAGKWVTIKEISGNATGLVGKLYLHYYLV